MVSYHSNKAVLMTMIDVGKPSSLWMVLPLGGAPECVMGSLGIINSKEAVETMWSFLKTAHTE